MQIPLLLKVPEEHMDTQAAPKAYRPEEHPVHVIEPLHEVQY